jgi:hypothetical protein
MNPGVYPEIITDIDLSSGDETMRLLMPDAPANLKAPAADDARNVGVISAEAIAPDPIRADAPEKPKSSCALLLGTQPSSHYCSHTLSVLVFLPAVNLP